MPRAQLPLDPDAVQAANRQLWRAFPELKGRQLTAIDDPKYKSCWINQYQAAGGAVENLKPQAPDAVKQPCQGSKKIDLAFRRVYWDGTPVPSVPYTVTLPDGSDAEGATDANGLVCYPDVTPGDAIVVYGNDFNEPQSSIQTETDPDLDELFAFGPDEPAVTT